MAFSAQATQVIEAAHEAARGRRAFRFVLNAGIFCCAVLGMIYLVLLNNLATRGFALQELKNDRMELQIAMEQMDIELAIPSSLYALGASEQVQEMDFIGKRYFLDVRESELAMVETGTEF